MPQHAATPYPPVEPRPAAPARLILLGLVAGCCGLGVTSWLDGSSQPVYSGRLQAHSVAVKAGRQARIVALPAESGTSVKPGDTLVVVADQPLEDRIRRQTQEVKELESEADRVAAAAEIELQWRQRDLQSERFELQLKAANLLQDKINRQVEQIAWQERLSSLSSWSSQEDGPFGGLLQRSFPDNGRIQAMLKEDTAASAAETIGIQLSLCENRVAEIEKLEKELETKVRISAGVNLAQQRLERAREELKTLEGQCDSLKITSPSYAIVGVPQRHAGDIVQAGETIVELLDPERRFLIAEVPSSAGAEFPTGSRVTLMFPGNEVRDGIVRELPPQTDQPTGRTQESFLEVRIEPAGRLWPNVPIGSRVNVTVLPETTTHR